MTRLGLPSMILAALALSACGEVDVESAGRNAAMAALEASHPEIVQGVRAAQTLRQAAATCGWQDVDATRLAQTAVSGIEEAPLRAAAESLVQDLVAAPAATTAPAPTSACTPEVRQALESQVAAIAGGGESGRETEGEAEAEEG